MPPYDSISDYFVYAVSVCKEAGEKALDKTILKLHRVLLILIFLWAGILCWANDRHASADIVLGMIYCATASISFVGLILGRKEDQKRRLDLFGDKLAENFEYFSIADRNMLIRASRLIQEQRYEEAALLVRSTKLTTSLYWRCLPAQFCELVIIASPPMPQGKVPYVEHTP